MTDFHPLDHPIWNALNGRQARFSMGDALARRFLPDVHGLGASVDTGPEALAAFGKLVAAGSPLARLDDAPPPPVPGTRIAAQAIVSQMVLNRPMPPGDTPPDWVDLGQAEAAEMLALALLTKPGPFQARTYLLGGFVGVKREGRLVAMAGERMKPDGHAEVSAVCTHPDWRGHRLGAGLTRVVIERIQARGEVPFLHAYPDNPAVAIYTALGFRERRELVFTVLEQADMGNGCPG